MKTAMLPKCLGAAAAALLALPVALAAEENPWGWHELSGATGGIVRYPNSMQSEDADNLFGEAWIKQSASFYKNGDSKLALFTQLNYVRDSFPNVWNNNYKFTFGATASTRIGDHLEVIFSLKHEVYNELETETELAATRAALDYYYYDEWLAEAQPAEGTFGFKKTTFKTYGTLITPGSLEEGDTNIVFSPGGEFAAHYALPDTKWTLSPFIDFHADWDRDQNNYNNKLRPAIGAKLIYPIHWGELFVGAKIEADYRPINDTLDIGPQIYFGWYKGWDLKQKR